MANFVTNSSNTVAVRKAEVIGYLIEPFRRIEGEGVADGFTLLVKMDRVFHPDIIFEQAATMAILQPLINAFHTAMES